jgi:hypothetical protein
MPLQFIYLATVFSRKYYTLLLYTFCIQAFCNIQKVLYIYFIKLKFTLPIYPKFRRYGCTKHLPNVCSL